MTVIILSPLLHLLLTNTDSLTAIISQIVNTSYKISPRLVFIYRSTTFITLVLFQITIT